MALLRESKDIDVLIARRIGSAPKILHRQEIKGHRTAPRGSWFNGGKEIQYPNEERILIPSPNVKDYSENPDMSAPQITKTIIDAMNDGSHQVIIANFANADMVGHTGNFEATKESIRDLDHHIEEILKFAKDNGYITILTADHGNAEIMINDDMTPAKTHTCSKVPFIIIPDEFEKTQEFGGLSDIAPTILKILGIDIPEDMTGKILYKI